MKKKIRFYKSLLIEIIETLCSICLVLNKISMRNHIEEGIHMRGHFDELKEYSRALKENKCQYL